MRTAGRLFPGTGLALAGALLLIVPWTEAGGAKATGLWLDLALHLVAWTLIVTEALRRRSAGAPPALVFLLPALGVAAVSAARAPYGYAAWLALFEMLSGLALTGVVVLLIARPGGVSRRQLASICVVAALPAAGLAIVQLVSGQRGTGAFVNPNHLGSWLAATAPLVVALLPEPAAASVRRRWLTVLALAVILAGVLASGSRGALLALAVTGVLAAIFHGRGIGRRARAILVAGATGFVLLASLVLWVRFADGTDIYRYDRLRIWPRSVEMLAAAPAWGIGPGQFAHRSAAHTFPRADTAVRYGRTFRSPHSHAVLWLVECGLLGALLLAAGLLATAIMARRGWRDVPSSGDERRIAAAAVAGLTVFAVVSVFDEPLAGSPLLFAAALLAALALPSPARRYRPSSPGRSAFLLTASITLVLAGSGLPAVSSHLAWRAQAEADPARRAAWLSAAARINPWQAFYPGEHAALMLAHAARPLDIVSYARIRDTADRAVALSPDEASFRVTRARLERRACVELFRDTVTCDRADADYRGAMAAAPTDARIRREAASYAALLERHDEAETRLREALELEPVYVAAWRDLVRVLRESGRTVAAAEAARQLAGVREEAATRTADSPYARAILDPGPAPGDGSGPAGEGG